MSAANPGDGVAVLLALSGLALLGTGRLRTGIRLLAVQGALLGVVTLARPGELAPWHGVLLAVGIVGLKGVAFPLLMLRARRIARSPDERDPYLGLPSSLAAGLVLLGVAVWLAHRLVGVPGGGALEVAVGLFLICAGLFMVVTRKVALSQVLGYVVLENGIALFGLTVAGHEPLLVELGVLLDMFVAVFVMGIAIVHIDRAFDHIAVDRLTALRD